MNNTEIWKDIPGYEGWYQVSNMGNIKSLSREVLRNGEYPMKIKEKILKFWEDKNNQKTLLSLLGVISIAFLIKSYLVNP
jgi:hypothetical protein